MPAEQPTREPRKSASVGAIGVEFDDKHVTRDDVDELTAIGTPLPPVEEVVRDIRKAIVTRNIRYLVAAAISVAIALELL